MIQGDASSLMFFADILENLRQQTVVYHSELRVRLSFSAAVETCLVFSKIVTTIFFFGSFHEQFLLEPTQRPKLTIVACQSDLV